MDQISEHLTCSYKIGSASAVFRVLELIGESVWQRHLITSEVSFTPGLWTALGYPLSTLPRSLSEALQIFDDADAERILDELKVFLEAEEGAYVTTAQVLNADGDARCLRFSGAVLARSADGTPLIVGGLVSDITRQIEEEKVRTRARTKIKSLSPRERLLLEAIVKGQTSKEIATAWALSPRTVEFYRSNLMRKIDAKRVSDLIRFASQADMMEKD